MICCCPFPIYICGIERSFDAQFVLFPAQRQKRLWFPQNYSPYFNGSLSRGVIFKQMFSVNSVLQIVMVMILFFDFFLNLGLFYNAVQYRHEYLNKQHISKRKNPCFVVSTTASPSGPPSVTSVLRMSVRPIKPASPFRLLCEQLPKVYVFSAIRFSLHFVLLFQIKYLISRSWLCFRSTCSVHC